MILAVTPEFTMLSAYPLKPIHAQMARLADQLGFRFVDLLPPLEGLRPAEIWTMPGDPHPNSAGHKSMARTLADRLSKPGCS